MCDFDETAAVPNLVRLRPHAPLVPRPDGIDEVCRRLRDLRIVLELTKPSDFIADTGFGKTRVSNWDKSYSRPDLDAGIIMAGKFGVTLDWLFLGNPAGLPQDLASKLNKLKPAKG